MKIEDLLTYIKNPVGWKPHPIGYCIKHSETLFESIINYNGGIILHFRHIKGIGEEGIEICYDIKK